MDQVVIQAYGLEKNYRSNKGLGLGQQFLKWILRQIIPSRYYLFTYFESQYSLDELAPANYKTDPRNGKKEILESSQPNPRFGRS